MPRNQVKGMRLTHAGMFIRIRWSPALELLLLAVQSLYRCNVTVCMENKVWSLYAETRSLCFGNFSIGRLS